MPPIRCRHRWKGFLYLLGYFSRYITERRQTPCGDVLSELAVAKFPDGTLPEIMDLVWIAAFLYGAGQDTTARLLSGCLRVLAERPELQNRLCNDRQLIPDFIEEALRLEGRVKCASRLAVRTTTIGGCQIAAGTTVALFSGAINRDPHRFEHPYEFRLDRPKSREHLWHSGVAHTPARARRSHAARFASASSACWIACSISGSQSSCTAPWATVASTMSPAISCTA